jgi:hypothetical protein
LQTEIMVKIQRKIIFCATLKQMLSAMQISQDWTEFEFKMCKLWIWMIWLISALSPKIVRLIP